MRKTTTQQLIQVTSGLLFLVLLAILVLVLYIGEHRDGMLGLLVATISLAALTIYIIQRRSMLRQQSNHHKLEKTAALLQAVMDSTAEAIIVVGREKEILFYNPQFIQLWRLPPNWDTIPDPAVRFRMVADRVVNPDAFYASSERLLGDLSLEAHDIVQLKDGRTIERFARPYWQGSQLLARLYTYRDITERRASDQALRRSEARLKAIFNNAATGITRLTSDGHFLSFNERWQEMLGYDSATLEKLNFLDLIHPDDHEAFSVLMQSLVEGHAQTTRVEKRFIHRDGHVFWGDLFTSAIRDADGRLDALLAILSDVTDRRLAHDALRKREAILNAMNVAVSDFLAIDDWEANIEHVLAALVQATDVSRAYIFQKHAGPAGTPLVSQRYEWVAPGITAQIGNPALQNLSFADAGLARWEEELSAGRPVFSHTRELAAAERPLLETQDIASIAIMPIFVDKQWWGLIGFDVCYEERTWTVAEQEALEIAARTLAAAIHTKQAESALRQSEERYRALFAQARDAIIIEDENEQIQDANDAAVALFGYPREELLAMRTRDLQGPEHQDSEMIQDDRFQTTAFDKAGHPLHLEVTVAPLEAGEQPLFISITRDMTAANAATEERERLIVELNAFAHTVAHDLKNPLNYMMASGEMLQEILREVDDDEATHLMKLIITGGRKMTSIINALLLLSSVRKQDEVPLETLPMERIVEGAVARVQQLVERHAAELIMPGTWPAAIGHAQWVEEIWDNFLSNAIKYGGQPPRIELGADEPRNGRVRFWVKDNGAGIPPDKQARLFTPFTRLEQASTKGHGLGLSIVRRIVEKLGGQVGVESNLGQGSCFHFTLPAAPTNSPKVSAGHLPVPTATPRHGEILSF